jgi:hypothetical protein
MGAASVGEQGSRRRGEVGLAIWARIWVTLGGSLGNMLEMTEVLPGEVRRELSSILVGKAVL